MCTVLIVTNAGAAGVLSTWKAQSCSGQWRLHSKPMTSPWSQAREQLPATWGAWLLYGNTGNLGEWSMSRPKLWDHQSLPWEWWTNHYHLSLLRPRCPPSVMANLYGLRCTFGCIIDINQISDYLQKRTMFTLDCANLSIVSWQTSCVVIKIARISEIDNVVLDQCGFQTTSCCIIL